METNLNKKVTSGFLLKFAMPTIISMVLMSLFGIIDGVFASRIIDPIALSATGIVFPFLTFVMSIGFMLGVGGNALVAQQIGEGKIAEARSNFNLIAVVSFLVSVALSLIGILFPELVLNILGANEAIHDMALQYLMPLLYFMPAIILGVVFQQFLITEGKAHISTITTVVGGVLNIFLNYYLMYVLGWELRGAAIATSVGYTIPAIVGILYFLLYRKGNLFFHKFKLNWLVLWKSSTNGASEMVTMLAISVTSTIMNNILIDIEGPEAVAAAGIMFAVVGILQSVFLGFGSGISPIISFKHGENNTKDLRRLFKHSIWIILILSVASMFGTWFLVDPIIAIYEVPQLSPIHDMTVAGTRIFTFGFAIMGINAFGSMLFTALGNGKVSAILSFFRTMVFVVISLHLLSSIFGLNGVWAAMPVAEALAIAMTIHYFKKMKPVYQY